MPDIFDTISVGKTSDIFDEVEKQLIPQVDAVTAADRPIQSRVGTEIESLTPEETKAAQVEFGFIDQPKDIFDEVQANPPRPAVKFKGFFNEFGRALTRGTLNVGAGIAGTVQSAQDFLNQGKFGGTGEDIADFLREKAEGFQPTEGGSATKKFIANAVGEALPFMIGTIGATLTAGPAAGISVAFSVEGDNAYQEALEAGGTEEEAQLSRLIVGSLNAALEKLQIDRLFGGAEISGKLIKQIVKSAKDKSIKKVAKLGGKLGIETFKTAVTEGVQEGLQEIVSIKGLQTTTGEGPTLAEAGKRVGSSALGGAVAGAFLGGAGGVFQSLTETTPDAEGFRTVEAESVDVALEAANAIADRAEAEGFDVEIKTDGNVISVRDIEPTEEAAQAQAVEQAPGDAVVTPEKKTPQKAAQEVKPAEAKQEAVGKVEAVKNNIKTLDTEFDKEFNRIKKETTDEIELGIRPLRAVGDGEVSQGTVVKTTSTAEPDTNTAEVAFSQQGTEGSVYRGTEGTEELGNSLESGIIKSSGQTARNTGKLHHLDKTFLSPNPNIATSYTKKNGILYELDSSVIADQKNEGAGEISTEGDIPVSAIKRVFRIWRRGNESFSADITDQVVTNLTEVGQQAQPTPTEQKAKAKPKPTEKPLTPETKQAQPKVVPEEVTTKETAKTVEDAIKTDVTDPAFPTSTKHDSTKEIRERLGIGQVNSKTRRSDEEAMSEAVKRKIPEKAGRIADEINTTARALSDIEDAGMRVAVAELEIEHEQIMKLIAESKDDADIKTLSAEVNRIETEFDSIISALETSGTEAGRALRARKVQISRDFSLVAVLNRAKAAVGQKLGATKERLFKQLTDKLNKTTKRVEVLETEVNDLKALKIVGRGARRFTSMTTQQRQVSRKGLTTKLNELLAKGCNN